MEEKTIIAIEIGSSKVRGAIGTYGPGGVLTVHAVEEEPLLEWVRYGAVSNVEEVASLVGRIIRKIENRVSPRKVAAVYVGMGGRSFCSLNRDVETSFADEVEITDQVIDALIDDAAASPYADRELLEVVPRQFIVDKSVVSRPKGTVGRRIRLSANLIVCRPQMKRNIDRLFTEKLKLDIAGYHVRQLALADVVLTPEERRLGCMLVDFGAETTAVSIYKDGHLCYMATLPLGSRNITRDIMKLNHLEEKAEELKCTVGNAGGNPVATPAALAMGGMEYSDINNYVAHRSAEIIANIRKQLEYAGMRTTDLPGGVVIVGGGSRLTGFNDRLSKALAMRLRVGSVNLSEIRIPDSRISPTDAVDVIALLYAASQQKGTAECLVSPAPVVKEPVVKEPEPEPEPAPQPEPAPEPEPAPKPEPQAPVKKKRSLADIIKEKIETMMREPDDDFMDD